MGGFGEGLGRVWGGFWEGFGKVWEPFGRSRAFSALFLDFVSLCWPFLAFSCSSWPFLVFPSLFSPFLGFAGLCWPLLGLCCFFGSFVQFFGSFCVLLLLGGERSERAKRASEALWCFLWVSIAYPCFRWHTLAFSCFLLLRFFACCLAFSFEWYLGIPSLILSSVSGCSLPSFAFSRFTLYQHFLNKIALPVHLLRQVSLGSFFRFFFAFFLTSFFHRFFFNFWRVLGGQNASQNRFLGSFLGCFFGTFILE